MIVDGILNLFYAILSPIIDLLPDGEFPFEPESTNVSWLGKLDYLFPFLAPTRWLAGVVASSLAAFLAYRIGLFIYTKIRG